MSKTFLVGLVSLAMLVVGSGCRTSMFVNFGNGTASEVWVTSLETGKQTEIRPRQFKNLTHNSGNLLVKTHENQVLQFADVAPFRLDQKYVKGHGSVFGFSSVTMTVLLETNMQLYVLMPSKRTIDAKAEQPKGFPKSGEILAK